MKFSEQIRVDIADRMIRVILPIILGTILASISVSLVFAHGQHHRLVAPLIGLLLFLPAWIISLKGRPMMGANLLMLCFVVTIAAGMHASGGVCASRRQCGCAATNT